MDHKAEPPQVDDEHIKRLEEAVFKPLETYRVGRNEIVAGTVAPSYISPLQGLQRLEKIMDEYVGGYSMFYVTSENLLNRGLEHSRYAHGGLRAHWRRGPAPAPKGMGAPTQDPDCRVGGPGIRAPEPAAPARDDGHAARQIVHGFHSLIRQPIDSSAEKAAHAFAAGQPVAPPLRTMGPPRE